MSSTLRAFVIAVDTKHAILTCRALPDMQAPTERSGGETQLDTVMYVIEQAAFPHRKGKGVPRMLRRGIDARAAAVGLDAQQAFILELPQPVNSLV